MVTTGKAVYTTNMKLAEKICTQSTNLVLVVLVLIPCLKSLLI